MGRTTVNSGQVDSSSTSEEMYRLPREGSQTIIQTKDGEVTLSAPGTGYFCGTAIFVFGLRQPLSAELKTAFFKATGFCLDAPWGISNGGSDTASAMITAGLDRHAYAAGKTGYFKDSPAPRLAPMAAALYVLLNWPAMDS